MEEGKYTFVFMGVSGSGKSVVAGRVANRLEVPFLDGDILHPRANVDKMAAGISLNDNDREPWLLALNSAIYAMQHLSRVSVLVCSALKEKYRGALEKNNTGVFFIYLKGSFDSIYERMCTRKDHFFKVDMLKSQFDTLEEPLTSKHNICEIDIDKPLNDEVDEALAFIKKVIDE